MRDREEEERYREAEAKCSLFMNTGVACYDCECGNNQHFRTTHVKPPLSRDALERRREAEKAVIEAAKAWAGSLNGSPMPLLEAVAALRALDASEGGA